ncbi:MAG: nickel-dependent lactate racemase [Armatimonadetes bacterium]|nr:nickel-dependent lactate racemase [Armatimonadota bacterium]
MLVALRYGHGWLEAELPDHWRVDMLEPPAVAGLSPDSARAAAQRAVDRPVGCPSLREMAGRASRVVIVVSDITRPAPNALILPLILDRLSSAGLGPERVTILIATGMHRPATPEELREIVGDEALASGVEIASHKAAVKDDHVYCGSTQFGTPVWVDRRYAEADLRIVIGLVEPHCMAGFSGGPKAICPGIVGSDTIMVFHGPRILSSSRAVQGNMESNPVYEEEWHVARLAGLPDLCISFVLNARREVVDVVGGEMGAAHRAACEKARDAVAAYVNRPAELVLTSAAGYPLDLTFYQGAKGLIAAGPIVRDGGGIILVERNAEGAGSESFAKLLRSCSDFREWLPDPDVLEASQIDEWQMRKIAQVASKATIVNVCPDATPELRGTIPLLTVDSVEDAIAALDRQGIINAAGQVHAAVMPEGPYTLPLIRALA